MKPQTFLIFLLVMAGVTYLIRALPLALFKSKVKNERVRSFLAYIPFAVLGAMTIPDIFYSTDMIASAVIALMVATFFAYKEKGLAVVALLSCCSVFVSEFIINRF